MQVFATDGFDHGKTVTETIVSDDLYAKDESNVIETTLQSLEDTNKMTDPENGILLVNDTAVDALAEVIDSKNEADVPEGDTQLTVISDSISECSTIYRNTGYTDNYLRLRTYIHKRSANRWVPESVYIIYQWQTVQIR